MNDERIIKMYYQGYSINHIAKCYCKYKNKNNKVIELDGIKLFPLERYTLSDAKLYIYQVIYRYILNNEVLEA